ncbi:MAG: FG-GAP-like repeat-containing protein [Bacteroidota bacterium]
MKQFYLVFVLVFGLQFGFGQINFSSNTVTDDIRMFDPSSVHSADLDGDGDLDVVSSSRNNEITWFENVNGKGVFVIRDIIALGNDETTFGHSEVLLVDIDGDGDIDVLNSFNVLDKISLYRNLDGNGTFGNEQVISTTLGGVYSISVGDVDVDGDIDILSAASVDDKISWHENLNGNGDFWNDQIISLETDGAKDVYGVDLDGDGDIDVLSASSADDKVAWYENIDGTGNFGAQQIIRNEADGAISVFSADLDGDNDNDVLFAQGGDDRIYWYENTDGLGTFQIGDFIEAGDINGVKEIYAADLDNDGDLDVLSSSSNDDKIAWYENVDGLGNYSDQIIITSFADSAYSLYAADLDGDNDVDVLSTSLQDDEINWHQNIDGQGNFSSSQIIPTAPNSPRSSFPIDIDGDGNLDVVCASFVDNKISWYRNSNNIENSDYITDISLNADGAISVYCADIDNDGDFDVISSSINDNKLAWHENLDGLGVVWQEHTLGFGVNLGDIESVIAVDLDNDGDKDILTASRGVDRISWFINITGQGFFGTQQNIVHNNFSSTRIITVSDIDNDGDYDVVSTSSADDSISWIENLDGQGNFGVEQIIATNIESSDIYTADIDGDGDQDIISTIYNDGVVWFENQDGLGLFGLEQVVVSGLNQVNNVMAVDMDNDGDQDIVSSINDRGEVGWYENISGIGDFSDAQFVGQTESFLLTDVDLKFGDFDNDGDTDILSTMNVANRVAWYENISSLSNDINGSVYFDVDSNNCQTYENVENNILIRSQTGVQANDTFSNNNGVYQLFVDEGSTVVSAIVNQSYFSISPESQMVNFAGFGNTESINFCISSLGEFNDLNISIYPSIDDPRPGFNTAYQIVYNNFGTTQLSGNITFEFDDSRIQFLNASDPVVSQTANTLTFSYSDLSPFESRTIDLEFNVFPPPTTNIDDLLVSTAIINPVSGDETEDDNVFELEQIVIGSYDPNDITVLQGDEIFIEDSSKYLDYLIRFQNTGTASAINVRVEHILDDKLDWSTMKLQSLSHIGRVEIENETNVSFIFDNINLPDNTSDEPNSHGYITFKIKPKSNVQVGDIISGVADIYFDFNPPIITNTVHTEIVEPLSVGDEELRSVKIHPNPAKDKIQVVSKQIIDEITIITINGRVLNTIEISTTDYNLDISTLPKGMYFIEIQSGGSTSTKKLIKN